MVVIRLARGGAKKRPFYHVVVADRRCRRDGKNIEQVGYFNPVARGNDVRLKIDLERVEHWINQGAQTSDRVALLIKEFKQGPEKTAALREAKANKLQQRKAVAKAAAAQPEESTEEQAAE